MHESLAFITIRSGGHSVIMIMNEIGKKICRPRSENQYMYHHILNVLFHQYIVWCVVVFINAVKKITQATFMNNE